MRSYTKRKSTNVSRDNGSHWLCFSDMMSALVLVFVLVMFYCMYQYFDMINVKEAEIAAQQSELDASRQELETSKAELSAQQEKVALAQSQLEESQSQLSLREEELASAQTQLSSQQEELTSALTLLETKEDELEDQRALYLSQQAQLESQQRQLDELVGVRAQIIESLANALSASDISASVDKNSGAITLEASVLFEKGSSDLTDAGKRMLDKFLPVYLSVLLSEEYEGSVSEIIIEGHTDSDGDYLDNLALSQQRALAVLNYVLSDEYTALSYAKKKELRAIVTANGRSESQLVYDENGVEDQDASRRVEFKFRLQDEQMIESMRTILESFD